MNERVWHKGPPPHAGWWEASIWQNKGMWRWWNGEYWSLASDDFQPAWRASRDAAKKAGSNQALIQWTDYYPENARVPRIAP